MTEFFFKKEDYSENVLRKALYWCSQYFPWEIEDKGDTWLVTVPEDNEQDIHHLHRFLNDFKLREQIDVETGHLRKKVIEVTLRRLAEDDR